MEGRMNQEEIKQELLKKIEIELEKQNAEHMDEVINAICEKLKEAIPGDQYDVVVDLIKPTLTKVATELAAKQIEKISPLV